MQVSKRDIHRRDEVDQREREEDLNGKDDGVGDDMPRWEGVKVDPQGEHQRHGEQVVAEIGQDHRRRQYLRWKADLGEQVAPIADCAGAHSH